MSHTSNRLIHSTSPYLLQHAYNPVDWFPWGEEAFNKAKSENKPVLVSIGYSSCHWCHVMERESFENEEVASFMNAHFVCIKVDREERPDVDQIYMDAVQAMGLNGGWPLNVFVLPTQEPFYGGTYFPAQNWLKLLDAIRMGYKNDYVKLKESALQFKQAIGTSEIKKYGLKVSSENDFTKTSFKNAVALSSQKFDHKLGGFDRHPKFPMPGLWQFYLEHALVEGNRKLESHVLFTLEEIIKGGIYDQIGGGLARYSVDAEWFAPHFEKMLYDNGQFLSLLAHAYALSSSEEFEKAICYTVDWLEREMTDKSNGFYSALDADSEGVEGKFYTWKTDNFEEILSTLPDEDVVKLKEFWNIRSMGNWEHGVNILDRSYSLSKFEAENSGFTATLSKAEKLLMDERAKRIRPGLDDKILCSWNAMTITGLIDAYFALGEPKFLELAVKNGEFILDKLVVDGTIYHAYKEKRSETPGFIDDYAFTIEAFIKLYEATFNENWLQEAKLLTDKAIENYFDQEEQFFFYTSDDAEQLIARKKEVFDNVTPASNAVMVGNLFKLSVFFDLPKYEEIGRAMGGAMQKLLDTEVQYLYRWAHEITRIKNQREVSIIGPSALEWARVIKKAHLNRSIMLSGTSDESELPFLSYKKTKGKKTALYICRQKSCLPPVYELEEGLRLLKAE